MKKMTRGEKVVHILIELADHDQTKPTLIEYLNRLNIPGDYLKEKKVFE